VADRADKADFPPCFSGGSPGGSLKSQPDGIPGCRAAARRSPVAGNEVAEPGNGLAGAGFVQGRAAGAFRRRAEAVYLIDRWALS